MSDERITSQTECPHEDGYGPTWSGVTSCILCGARYPSFDAATAEVNTARPGWEFGGCWQVTPMAWIAQAIKWNLVESATFESVNSPEADSLVAALRALASRLREIGDKQ